ncbi:hypothetical protein C8R44DRAFT_227034 [Mycena epipterygia]|nr:hypothetical protein C8R44DRAFT_227034 [Mycena epipterygia]
MILDALTIILHLSFAGSSSLHLSTTRSRRIPNCAGCVSFPVSFIPATLYAHPILSCPSYFCCRQLSRSWSS